MRLARLIIGAFAAVGFAVAVLAADDAANAPAAGDAKPGVTLITINAHNMTPKETFDEIGKQAHVEFTTNGNFWDQQGMNHKIDVDLTARPFWSAVNEICEQCNVAPQANYGNGDTRIMLNRTGNHQAKPPTFEQDGLLVQALSFNRQQNINFANPTQANNSCGVQIMVCVDPGLKVVSFNQGVKPDEAVDDAGNSMVPDQKNQTFYGGGQQKSLMYNFQVPLKYPDNVGKKIASLKFTLGMTVSDEVEALTVDKPLEAEETSKDIGDVSVTFRSLKKTGNGYELKVAIGTTNTQQYNNLFSLAQSGRLLDENGKAYNSFGGGGGGNMRKAEYTINYGSNGSTPPPGDPVKWVLELPTKTHEMKVPVEFTDLPLP